MAQPIENLEPEMTTTPPAHRPADSITLGKLREGGFAAFEKGSRAPILNETYRVAVESLPVGDPRIAEYAAAYREGYEQAEGEHLAREFEVTV